MPKDYTMNAYYLSDEWAALRQIVVNKAKHVCAYCGLSDGWQADHVIPRHKGGPDHIDNLVACCARCNKLLGGKSFRSFDHKKQWLLKELAKKGKPSKNCKWDRNGERCNKAPMKGYGFCREHWKIIDEPRRRKAAEAIKTVERMNLLRKLKA